MEDIYNNIPAEQFQFVEKQDLKHEKTLETKPRSYLADAFSRFCKNKGSIVGACVIFILVLYAIFGSIFSQYSVSHRDTYSAMPCQRPNCLPTPTSGTVAKTSRFQRQRSITIIIWVKKRGITRSKIRNTPKTERCTISVLIHIRRPVASI